jgi:hypothetical protein
MPNRGSITTKIDVLVGALTGSFDHIGDNQLHLV